MSRTLGTNSPGSIESETRNARLKRSDARARAPSSATRATASCPLNPPLDDA
jgi:hypothetical protein